MFLDTHDGILIHADSNIELLAANLINITKLSRL